MRRRRECALFCALSLLSITLSSCAIVPIYCCVNEPQGAGPASPVPEGTGLASYEIPWDMDWRCRNAWMPGQDLPTLSCPRNDANFIALSISGGGSRAAVFAAAVMFELGSRYDVLDQVDAVSSSSGGSLTSAFYVLSCNPEGPCPQTLSGPERFRWERGAVFERLERDFIRRWLLNMLKPNNFLPGLFTYYDRTDIMAATLANNLFDNSLLGINDFSFKDFNPQRPSLLINAVNNTDIPEGTLPKYFSFTVENFRAISSGLDSYPVAYAVMASAAYPGAFHYVTLRDYTADDRYVHLFDAGARDNLALLPFLAVSRDERYRAAKKLVILIDAYTGMREQSRSDPDPRTTLLDRIVDANAIDALNAVQNEARKNRVAELQAALNLQAGDAFLYLQFSDLMPENEGLCRAVSGIETNFTIADGDAQALKEAARLIVEKKMTELLAHPYWGGVVHRRQ